MQGQGGEGQKKREKDYRSGEKKVEIQKTEE